MKESNKSSQTLLMNHRMKIHLQHILQHSNKNLEEYKSI